MSAHAWKRRRAKALLRDPVVRQWFKDCGDEIARELAKYRWVGPCRTLGSQWPWRLSMHGLSVYMSEEFNP